MKIISMYLPQFHRVKENDEWWGEGFTEWTAVKNAKKMYKEHYQPRVPLDIGYYDLLDRSTMENQAKLMKEYSVDGQCFYHYWFKDGRKILEKPAENLLKWKDIEMSFCFCWANESWARTWSKIKEKNVWSSNFEKDNNPDIAFLLEQSYGDEKQWKAHFDYLLPFFKDKRYMKKDNKPIFYILKPVLITLLDKMIDKWNQWALENGVPGIYFIGANSNRNVEKFLDAVLYHEPLHTMHDIMEYNSQYGRNSLVLDYDEVWNKLLSFCSNRKNVIYGGFVGYDDTPRHGMRGRIIKDAEPQKFCRYLTELLAKNVACNNDLIFINAWNEWGEGMYMEPDERYGYDFLEAVRYAKEHYQEYIKKYENLPRTIDEDLMDRIAYLKNKSNRYETYWRIMDKWLELKESSISLEKYFTERGFLRIAIYGMGMLGKHLYRELIGSKVNIEYAIDRKGADVSSKLKVYEPDETYVKVDAIIVTVPYDFMKIKEHMEIQGHRNVISIEEILLRP